MPLLFPLSVGLTSGSDFGVCSVCIDSNPVGSRCASRRADREGVTLMLLRWLQDMPKRIITGRQGSRGRTVRRTPRGRQLGVEALEDRTVPAPVSWINPAGGDWGTASNWSTGAVPGTADDVTINLSGNVTVTHSANVTDTIHSLVNSDTLQIAVGIVNVATFQNSGTVSIANGSMLAVN